MTSPAQTNSHHRPAMWPGLLLLLVSVILSLCVYQDYGIAWDEPQQRQIGDTSYNYVFNNDPSLKTYTEKDHGVGVELPLVMIERAAGFKDISEVYLMRHLVCNLFFLVAVFCGYILVLRLFKSQWLAILAFLLLAFMPRMYAHSYFNSKDVPFLSMFIVCFTVAEVAFRKGKWTWHVLLGIACGYTTSIRILAMVLPACLGMFYIIDLVTKLVQKRTARQEIVNGFSFVGAYCLSLYACWPILWEAPMRMLVANYESMKHFRWTGHVLFFGKEYSHNDIPAVYIPGWFAITVPELWLLLGVAGVTTLITRMLRCPKQYLSNTPERNFVLYFFCLAVPLFMVIALHAVVLDDWRHLYFIYPSFILMMLWLLHRLLQQKIKWIVIALCIVQLGETAWFMIRNHPFQQVYFNRFVSHEDEYLRKNFDLDYWGCSLKQGYEYLLETDTSSQIKIDYHTRPLQNNTLIFGWSQRQRLVLAGEEKDATYYLTFFRNAPGDKPQKGKVIHEIKVLNSTIMRVQKLRE